MIEVFMIHCGVIKRAFGAVVVLAALVSCSSDKQPDGSGKHESRPAPSVKLTKVTDDTCDLIFDDKALAEVHKNPKMKAVYIPRDDLFFRSAGVRMSTEMTTFKPDMGGCYLADKKKRELLSITTNWGPKKFPENDKQAGRVTSYMKTSSSTSYERFQLLVDCERPDLLRKSGSAHERLPVQVNLKDHASLSSRTRVSLLSRSAERITHELKCRNNLAYPDPESVQFTQ